MIIVKRNTVQRTLVLETVRSLHNHPTADEIYEKVQARCPNISRGTVYRNLNNLAANGDVLRVQVANAPDRFDFTVEPHAHFRCRCCGRVFDFRLPDVPLPEGLNEGFTVEDYQLVFCGSCPHCKN